MKEINKERKEKKINHLPKELNHMLRFISVEDIDRGLSV